jgi:hypothetical protein
MELVSAVAKPTISLDDSLLALNKCMRQTVDQESTQKELVLPYYGTLHGGVMTPNYAWLDDLKVAEIPR